jgi:hypothetical protein
MKTSITACLLTLALAACATQPAAERRTPTGQVPVARIYIPSMLQQSAGLAEVQFSRTSTFLYGSSPLELAINDVVLAQILSDEHFSIWLRPGASYTFGVRPVYSLNSQSYPQTKRITVDVKGAGLYKVQIGADRQGPTLQQEN